MHINISVIIPTFNSENYILKTLDSVRAQTLKPYEVILTDDGSKDGTLEILEKFKSDNPDLNVTILRNSHSGPSGNRNHGIRVSTGNWIAFLDSDDLWKENKLAAISQKINEKPCVDLWCHNEILIHNKKETLLEHHKSHDPNLGNSFLSLYRANSLSTSAVVCKRKFLAEIQFDPSLPAAQDYDLWLRLAKVVTIDHTDEVLGLYIIRKGNISSRPWRRLKCLLKIFVKCHDHLKAMSPSPFFEEIGFLSRAFIGTGHDFLLLKKKIRATLFVGLGVLLNPIKIKKALARTFSS